MGLSNQVRLRPISGASHPFIYTPRSHLLGFSFQFRSKTVLRLLSGSPPVKHPSGDGTAVLSIIYCSEGACVIKCYRALVGGVVIFIPTLLAGFVPLLQVAFIVDWENRYRWIRCERSGQIQGSAGWILITRSLGKSSYSIYALWMSFICAGTEPK